MKAHCPHPLAWTAAELAADPAWTFGADRQLEGLLSSLLGWAAQQQDPEEALAAGAWATTHPQTSTLLRQWCQPLEEQLRQGRGVVRLTGLQGVKEGELRLLVLAMGLALGRLDRTYGLLHAVRDSGQSHLDRPIPVSQTRAAPGMHTDSSQRLVHPRWVGLACVRPAASGGASALASVRAVHGLLLQQDPALVVRLRRSFIRDVVTPGGDRDRQAILANTFPIFSGSPADPTMRYMRYWIEKGQQEAGHPLDAGALADLDRLDAALNAPEFRHEFLLLPGDLLLLDNHRITHDRTTYRDEPSQPRLMLRLWLNADARVASRR
ncbi:MAG: TauD/TfdA family dioxygenase [Cyanobacteriota bacterium]